MEHLTRAQENKWNFFFFIIKPCSKNIYPNNLHKAESEREKKRAYISHFLKQFEHFMSLAVAVHLKEYILQQKDIENG